MLVKIVPALAAIFSAPLIAEGSPLPPPGEHDLYGWLVCLLAVMGMIYLGLQIWALISPKRQPSVDVELTSMAKSDRVAHIELTLPTLATKGELEDMERRTDLRRSQGIGNLHGKLDEVERATTAQIGELGTSLARVEAYTETNTSAVAELSRKIDLILQRLPRRNS